MRNSEFNANRELAATAAASRARPVGKRHQRRTKRARRLYESCKAPGTGPGLVTRGVGLLLAFAGLLQFAAGFVGGGA